MPFVQCSSFGAVRSVQFVRCSSMVFARGFGSKLLDDDLLMFVGEHDNLRLQIEFKKRLLH